MLAIKRVDVDVNANVTFCSRENYVKNVFDNENTIFVLSLRNDKMEEGSADY